MSTTSALAAALATGDSLEVALALRNGEVVVPMLPSDGPAQVRVFRRDDADKYMLLLFSSPETYSAMLPDEDAPESALYDAAALLDFLAQNVGVLETVWFDVAGPTSSPPCNCRGRSGSARTPAHPPREAEAQQRRTRARERSAPIARRGWS